MVMIPICGSTLNILYRYSLMADRNMTKKDAIWQVVSICLWDTMHIPNPSISMIILLTGYCMATFVLITEYMSNFTSLMVVKEYHRHPIDKENQLWASDMKWISGRMTNYYVDYFSHIKDVVERLHHIRNKAESPELKSAIDILISNTDEYVYFEKRGLVEWGICNYDIDLADRKVYYSQDTVGNYYTYMYFRKGYPYTESFNRKILLLQEMAIINMNHIVQWIKGPL